MVTASADGELDVRFSVVIPTIGRPHVGRAVASALGQAHAPERVIVVDNGPMPGASERFEALSAQFTGDPRLLLLSLPPRSGPGVSRNVGAWHAETPYVAFLDDDDQFDERYLQLIAACVRETDADVVYGRKVKRDRHGGIDYDKPLDRFPREVWLQRMLAQKNDGFGGQNVVVRRDRFFEVGGFPIDLRTGQDRGFAIAALRADLRVEYVGDAVVNCHPPDGYRAKADPSRWQTYLKIMVDNWSAMTWATRRTSLRKTAKAFVVHLVKRRRARRGERARGRTKN